jgi:hypothetical protein
MPCSDGREFEDRQEQRKALDAATRAACELGSLLRRTTMWRQASKEAKMWHIDHCRRDAEQAVQQPKYS